MPSSSPLPSHVTPSSSSTTSSPSPAASRFLHRLLQSAGQHKKAPAIVLVLLVLVPSGVIFGWLGAVVCIVLLLGMVLGALISRRYAVHTDAPTRRRSSVSTPAKQALAPQQQQKNKRGDIEESVIDVYTTTEIDDEDDDDDSATASRFQDPHDKIHPQQHHRQPHHLPEESYLSEFSVSQAGHDEPRQRYSSRDFTYEGGDASHDFTTYGGDETSFAGYSISAAIDTGASVLQPPSFRHHFGKNNNNDRQRRMSDSIMASSFLRQSSAKTLPIVVQRIVKAPPGRLGITIHITKEGPKVQSVRTSSPLDGLLFPGDIIVAINTTDVRTMTLAAVHKIMEETNGMQRIIKVLTMDDVTRTQLPKKAEESA
jgi:hypothetical protein